MIDYNGIIPSLFKKVKGSTFIKSTLTISSGIAIAQGINLILSPVYSRIYTPEVFGDFSVMTSLGTIISSIICLGMMTAVMLPKDEKEAQQVCTLILSSILLLGSIIFVSAILFAGKWQAFSVSIPYWQACLIVFINMVLLNISTLYYSFTNRKAMYRVIFWNPILGVAFNSFLTIILGMSGWGLIGYSIGTISASIVTIFHMSRHVHPFLLKNPELLETLKRYKNFPFLQLPANIISTFSAQIPIQLLSFYFGNTILGIFSMTMKFLGIPTTLLAAPINRVYFRDASKKYAAGEEIGTFTFRILKANVKLAVIPIAFIMIFGEPLFAFFLGEKWRMAGNYAEVMGMYSLVAFSSACVSGGFVIIQKQQNNLIISIISIIANTVAFVGGVAIFHDPYWVLVCFSAVNIIIQLSINGWFLNSCGIKVKDFFNFVVIYILFPSAAAIGIKFLLKMFEVL